MYKIMFLLLLTIFFILLYKPLTKYNQTPTCAIVVIAKNEKPYIEEFIAYYLKLGCKCIFIYDNSDDNELAHLNTKKVKVIHFPGNQKQIESYNHFLNSYKSIYDYVAFFDVDEFLVLKKHKNIGQFCKEIIPNGALGINWYLFGNNGHLTYQDKPVVNRFTRREDKMNKHVKTIAKCCDIISMNVHNPAEMKDKTHFKNTFGEKINGTFNYHTDDTIVQINHYFSKSNQELQQKCERGRSDIAEKRKFQDYLHYLDYNQVEDKTASIFFNS